MHGLQELAKTMKIHFQIVWFCIETFFNDAE